jgi:hypothetical protein
VSVGARSQPPDLPNFDYRSWLGGGGFADVFLYEQVRPRRQVAVKVLRTGSLDAADLRAFDAEADLMAKVSAHPYIVSIYGADVAPDGRPYLVMEYYPKPNFGQRSRGSGLPVQEVLRVGVRVASAVETAHRAGILHRDIKPANILVNDYDRPGLTDFGIAGASDGSTLADAQGVTVAYAPPEVLADERVQGDEIGDVYSLAATLYALLAGRSPFEVPHGDNSAQALLHRTLNTNVPTVGRSDVPRSLELLLAQALAKDPAHRPGSAAALARALQGIERELDLAPTDFELAGGEAVPLAPARDDDDADSTRAGRIQVVRPIDPSPPSAPIRAIPVGLTQARGAVEPPVAPARGVPAVPAASDTIARPASSTEPETTAPPRPAAPRRHLAALAGGLAVAAIVTGVVISAASGGPGTEPTTTTTHADESVLAVPDSPEVPTITSVTLNGDVAEIAWDLTSVTPADEYELRRTDGGHRDESIPTVASSPAQVGGIGAGETPCFEVRATLGHIVTSWSAEECAS